MKRDTPKELPAIPLEGPGELPARTREMDTLEALYQAWSELRLEHAAARARFADERSRLGEQGSFLVGAVRAAGDLLPPPVEPSEEALAPRSGEVDRFLQEAEGRLREAREALEQRGARTEAEYAEVFKSLRLQIAERARRYLQSVKPRLRLFLRPVGAARAVLHVARVSGDEAVLLLYLFAGKLPSRYDFLFDDSTEDLALPPAPLYPEEGVEVADIRPGGTALLERVIAKGEVLPVKGFLPVLVPRAGGGEDFFRLLQRGPVMEAERWDGETFRGILGRDEAERLAGRLLALKLEGRIELDLEAG